MYFYYSKHACNGYIVILIQLSQVYINNQITLRISNNGLIATNHHITTPTANNNDSRFKIKEKHLFIFGQILDKA